MGEMPATLIAQRAAERTHAMHFGIVYFVEMVRPQLIKIGFCKNLDERMAGLRTTCPFELRIYEWFHGTKDDERRLQSELRPWRYRREWFRPVKEIDDFIYDIFEYQADVISEGPLGTPNQPDPNAVLQAIAAVPMTGFWEWRDLLSAHGRWVDIAPRQPNTTEVGHA